MMMEPGGPLQGGWEVKIVVFLASRVALYDTQRSPVILWHEEHTQTTSSLPSFLISFYLTIKNQPQLHHTSWNEKNYYQLLFTASLDVYAPSKTPSGCFRQEQTEICTRSAIKNSVEMHNLTLFILFQSGYITVRPREKFSVRSISHFSNEDGKKIENRIGVR